VLQEITVPNLWHTSLGYRQAGDRSWNLVVDEVFVNKYINFVNQRKSNVTPKTNEKSGG
jgi:hypothetical protein